MTKSITVERQQASNFAEKKYTVGLDLGDRWSWYCVLDERGEVVFGAQGEYHAEGAQRGVRGVAAPSRRRANYAVRLSRTMSWTFTKIARRAGSLIRGMYSNSCAMNGSSIRARIAASRSWLPPASKSGIETSSARASRVKVDNVGVTPAPLRTAGCSHFEM
jgi:hypothetical protein